MTETTNLIIAIVGAVISFLILYWIIGSAVRAEKNQWHDEIKIRLLIRIAEKLGVTEEEIDKAIGGKK